MFTLPAVPDHIGFLTEGQSARIAHSEPRRPCTTCRDTGTFRWWDDMGKASADRTVVDWECNCSDQFRLRRYLTYHGLGGKFWRRFWGDTVDVDESVRDSVLGYVEHLDAWMQQGTGLFMWGEHGNGKSLLASLVLRSFIAAGRDGYWTTLVEMYDRYTSTWRDDDEREWFDATVRRAPVLVIDDVGKGSPAFRDKVGSYAVDGMLRSRVQNGLVTIVTANCDRDQISAEYSSAVASLVDEACLPLVLHGMDWRKRKTDQAMAEVREGLSRPVTLGGDPDPAL